MRSHSSQRNQPNAKRTGFPLPGVLFAVVGGLLLLVAGVGFWLFVSDEGSPANDVTGVQNSGGLAKGSEVVEAIENKFATTDRKPTSTGPISAAISSKTLQKITPVKIVDRWFDIRQASEERQRLVVAKKGSAAYESRIECYLVGERRSRRRSSET